MESCGQVTSVHTVEFNDHVVVHLGTSDTLLVSVRSGGEKAGVVGSSGRGPALCFRWSALDQLHGEPIEIEWIEHVAMLALAGLWQLLQVECPCTLL